MLRHVLFAGFSSVIHRVHRVPMRQLGVMTGSLMGADLVMLCCLTMMTRRFLVVVSCLLVVLGALVRSHWDALENGGPA